MQNNEDNTIEFRSASRYESEAKGPDGKSFVRVTSFETKRTVNSKGEDDFLKKHLSITNPENASEEMFINRSNNRSQHLQMLRNSFLSNMCESERSKPDPFARFNTRSMPDAGAFQDRFIEIHKFPFAEPFSTPDSIKKEQVSYSTTTQVKSGKTITNVVKTEIKGDTGSCSIVETKEVTTYDDNSKPTIEEVIE